MNKDASPQTLIAELEISLGRLDDVGALTAAAYVDAAIEALCREFHLKRVVSKSD